MSWNESFTWRGMKTPDMSQDDCARACIEEAEKSAVLEAAARKRYRALRPGDKELGEAMEDIRKFAHEQAHFRRAADHHWRMANEERKVREAAAIAASQRPPAPRPQVALPEPGSDLDEDDLHTSPWEDIGRGVHA